jgi:hypothetical protein
MILTGSHKNDEPMQLWDIRMPSKLVKTIEWDSELLKSDVPCMVYETRHFD